MLGTWAEEESVAKGATAVACARILAPGVSYAEQAGRVATRRDQRGKGIGKELMRRSIEVAEQTAGTGHPHIREMLPGGW